MKLQSLYKIKQKKPQQKYKKPKIIASDAKAHFYGKSWSEKFRTYSLKAKKGIMV